MLAGLPWLARRVFGPDGGRRAGDDRQPAVLRGYLHELPGFPALEDEPAAAPSRPAKIPAGVP